MSRPGREDAGLTLVELLIAMSLMIVLSTVAITVVRNGQDALNVSRVSQDLNEEARQALNRMARDIRQANRVVTAVNPDGPLFTASGLVAVRFQSDYDGDGCVGGVGPSTSGGTCLPYSSANPEDLTYCYQPGSAQLFVIDNQAPLVTPVTAGSVSCFGGQPLLAGNVAGFQVEYRSNQYRYDLNPSDGLTTWLELDEATLPTGNSNGQLDAELGNVDSVVLYVTMAASGRRQTYKTQVDMRNVSR